MKLVDLSDNVRIKRGGPFMHLKAYSIDGDVLRSGSANFSTSGEIAQDNDLNRHSRRRGGSEVRRPLRTYVGCGAADGRVRTGGQCLGTEVIWS